MSAGQLRITSQGFVYLDVMSSSGFGSDVGFQAPLAERVEPLAPASAAPLLAIGAFGAGSDLHLGGRVRVESCIRHLDQVLMSTAAAAGSAMDQRTAPCPVEPSEVPSQLIHTAPWWLQGALGRVEASLQAATARDEPGGHSSAVHLELTVQQVDAS